MGRRPCCEKEGLNRGAWTALEDKILSDYMASHGEGRWRSIPRESGLKRCGKSCRLRWLNYLRPDIKRGNITPEEEDLIVRLHNLLGNRFSPVMCFGRWSLIAGRLPGRTDNEIKNYWNTTLGKKEKKREKKKPTAKAGAARSDVVIKTKATRCTKKVVLVESHPEAARDPDSGSGTGNEGEGFPSTVSESSETEKLGLGSGIGELPLEDMSDSEFWKFCQFDGEFALDGNGKGNGNGSQNLDGFLFLEDEMTKNWVGGDDHGDDFLRFLI